MKIAVLGTGYVGLSTGVCLSEIGHEVICIDIDEDKVSRLRQGFSPIYEPGLEQLLMKNMSAGRLDFTISHKDAFGNSEIIIIAVGTPQQENGSADLSYLEKAALDIAAHLMHDAIIVLKSTVPVGTNEKIKKILLANCRDDVKIEIVSNPEFLRQGSAIFDTMNADRIVIGSECKEASEKVREMYLPLNVPILLTSTRSAEMIKYASNAFLATKISFINEIANVCEVVGANIEEVAAGMGKDKRIGAAFLQAGIGYGGSCFPKDVKALLHTVKSFGIDFFMLQETVSINEQQRERLVIKALNRFGQLQGKRFAILGLAFKPETDDMREAPSITITNSLTKLGAEVVAYDPVAMDNAKKVIGDSILYVNSVEEAAKDADAVFIVTEWKEVKQINLAKLTATMKQPIIFDGRNCFEEDNIRTCPTIEYYPIGKPFIIIKNS